MSMKINASQHMEIECLLATVESRGDIMVTQF